MSKKSGQLTRNAVLYVQNRQKGLKMPENRPKRPKIEHTDHFLLATFFRKTDHLATFFGHEFFRIFSGQNQTGQWPLFNTKTGHKNRKRKGPRFLQALRHQAFSFSNLANSSNSGSSQLDSVKPRSSHGSEP